MVEESTGLGPVLAVIPARGGSKGLPGKNVRPLAGLPLIAHSIRCAGLCGDLARVVVTTDSEEIAAVARAHGADVPFLRPADLARDDTPMWPVLQHALREVERQEGRRYDALLLLDPTSPGRLPEDLSGAMRRLGGVAEADGIVGVSQPEFNPYWHCVLERDGYLAELIPGSGRYGRRQDLPTVYRINASLYGWKRDFLLSRDGNWQEGRILLYEVPEFRSIHIDDEYEFRKAEALISNGLIDLPWLRSQP